MQYYARIDYNYGGSIYTIPFLYTHKTDIKVYVDGEEYTDFEFLNNSQIQLNDTEGFTEETAITIKRETDITQKVVDYQNMSMVLDDGNLNSSQDQLLYSAQEVYDRVAKFEETMEQLITSKIEEMAPIREEWKTIHKELVDFMEALENGAY